MEYAVIPPRLVVDSEEALCWFPFVAHGVMGGFSPLNQELNVV